MNINIELTEADVKRLIVAEIQRIGGDALCTAIEKEVVIEVKSKQNYKAEWEKADIRARFVRLT